MIKRSLRIHTRRSSLPPATSPPLSLTPTCSQIQPQLKFPHIYLKFLPTPPPTCRALRPPRPQLQPGTICLLPEDLNQSFQDQQHICTSNSKQHFSIHAHMHFQRNLYSTTQLIMVSTSTAQLLASQDINRLFRLCVHLGPASSHISQPLVASFDKTATAPQTEQQ